MHLIGLIVASKRVHHEIDAEAIGEFALALTARNDVDQRAPLGVDSPRGGPVVAPDNYRRDTVATASRFGPPVGIAWRKRFDPDFATVPSAGKLAQEIKGFC